MVQTAKWDDEFVSYLRRIGEEIRDRGALAALRRGLGKEPGSVVEMYPLVVPWLPPNDREAETLYFLVASLYAWHPKSWKHASDSKSNLARSLVVMVQERKRRYGVSPSSSLDHRFQALLQADWSELFVRLREMIGLLRADEVPVDWHTLLRDLRHWRLPDRRVQRSWARTFWGEMASATQANGHEGHEGGEDHDVA